MRFDFTPRRLFAPTPEEAAKLNQEIEKLVGLYQKVDKLSAQQARSLAESQSNANNLNNEIKRLEKSLDDLIFSSDYLYRSFQEQTAELRNQNVLLKIGKAAFNDLTNQAQKLFNFQQGYSDLQEKDFKKIQSSLKIQGNEIGKIIDDLAKNEEFRKDEIRRLASIRESGEKLNKTEKERLNTLLKEQGLYEAAKDAQEGGLKLLEKELSLSKTIGKARQDIGGLAGATAATLSKFGGDLAQYLDISEASEAVAEYNKEVIDSALKQEDVVKKLQQIEAEKVAIQQSVLDAAKAVRDIEREIILAKEAQKDTTDLETDLQQKRYDLKIKEASIDDQIAAKEQEAYKIKEKAIKDESTGLTGFINKFKSLGVLIDNLNFTKVFTDPVVLMTTLVNLGFKANAQAVELGKSFGISADKAGDIRQETAEFARNTGDTFINTDRLLKAQSELSKELGIAVKFSNEELATFAKLTELTGLSAQEAGKLALAAKSAGMPTEDYTDSLREAAFFAQQSTETHFDSREILQDVSKLSAGILVKFQGNPKAIGQAVVEAKKLGLTLDQIDKVGESLLNFEQSIENELKAELITGKQINLERARAAALSGDQLTLTKEISSQVGSLNDYQKMNVVAQKTLAEAFGLSREEMSEMLMKQEAINKYGKEAADLNKEQLQALKDSGLSASEFLKKQEQQRTAQAKFQEAMVKLQTIIANLVDGPVGELLDAFADIAGIAIGLLKVFEPLFQLVAFVAKKIGDFAGTDLGKVVLSLGAISLFLPKIVGGLGLATKGILSLGKGMLSVFKKDTWMSFGEGIGSIFKKDTYTDFFKTLKDKFLESAGLSKKLKEGVEGVVADKTKEVAASATEKVVEAGEESLTDKLKDKATETIEGKVEGKVEDKAGELADKVTGGADEVTEKTKGGGVGGFLKGIKMNDVLKGAAAILILSGALFVAAKAFQEFADVNWEDMAKAGVALVGLATIAGIVGSPLVIGFIEAGAFALGSLGLALIPFALAARIAAPAIEMFGKAIKSAFEGIGTIITAAANGIATIFGSLQNVDVMKLLAIGPALIGIGAGLASLGAGGVIGAIGSFLSGDPIEKLQGLAASGDGLQKTATALQSIAGALIGVSAALASIDTSKLEALDEFSNNQASNSAVGGITSFITAPIKAIGEAIGGGDKEEIKSGIDLTPMIAAINEVKAAVDRLHSKDTVINMDSKQVGSLLVQGSRKFA